MYANPIYCNDSIILQLRQQGKEKSTCVANKMNDG